MKRQVLIMMLLAVSLLFSCNQNNEKKLIKSYTTKAYDVKMVNGQYVKDTLFREFKIEIYENGERKSFIPLFGFSVLDTTFFQPKIITKKQIDNILFVYNNAGLQHIEKTVRDTILKYYSVESESPSSYEIFNKNKQIVEDWNDLLSEKSTYINSKFNNNNDLIYTVLQNEYVPRPSDLKYDTEFEIAKRKVESKKIFIIEKSYEYY